MNIKSLIILILFLLAGAGTYFFSEAKNSINSSESIGSAVLSDLHQSLNDISELQVIGAGNQVMSTLLRTEKGWLVKERNQYPADITKIRLALLSLAEANMVEQKTSNVELYEKLGVESVDSKDAQGVEATLRFNNQTIALVVGKPGPQINKSRYVRLSDSETSWLVDRKIDLKHEPEYWLQKDIVSIEPDEISSVTILLQDNSRLEIGNTNEEENVFEVTNLTDPNTQVVDAELHQVTNALSSFQLLDVADSSEFSDLEPTMQVSYQLKNDVKVNITAYEVGTDHFASFSAELNAEINPEMSPEEGDSSDAAQKYVDELQKITSGWVYKIPNVSYDSMYKREADVLAITEDQLN